MVLVCLMQTYSGEVLFNGTVIAVCLNGVNDFAASNIYSPPFQMNLIREAIPPKRIYQDIILCITPLVSLKILQQETIATVYKVMLIVRMNRNYRYIRNPAYLNAVTNKYTIILYHELYV